MICDTRQMIGSFIIIYVIVLNGYAALYLISDKFFVNEENNNIPKKKQEDENSEKEDKKEENYEKEDKK
jgi:ribosomal protein L9